MKNKEDASKAKSDEYLAFEALAKRIITTNKEDIREKIMRNPDLVKPKRKKDLVKKS